MQTSVSVTVVDLAHVDGTGAATFTVQGSDGSQWRVTARGPKALSLQSAMADGAETNVERNAA